MCPINYKVGHLTKCQLDTFLAQKQSRAYTMALLATGQKEDALDIVQDAMYKLVEKYRDKNIDELAPLFHRILQSKIKDWYRRKQIRNAVMFWVADDNDDATYQATNHLSPERQLNSAQQCDELLAILATLPLRQQQCFLLRCWEGFDVKETALAMNCSQGSVKTHYFRALKVIKAKLSDEQSLEVT